MYGKPPATASVSGAAAAAAQGLKPKEIPSSKVIQVGSRHGDSGTKVVPNQGQGKNGGLEKGHGTDINGNHNQGTGNTGSPQQDNSHGINIQTGHGNGISQTPGSQVQSPGSNIAHDIERSAPHGSPAEAIHSPSQETSNQGVVSQPSFNPGSHESTGSTGSGVVSQPSFNPGSHASGSVDSGHFAPSGGMGMHDFGSSMPASMPSSMPGQAMDSAAHGMEAVSNSPIGQIGHTYLTVALAPQDLQILHYLPGNIEQMFAILFVKTATIWLPSAIFAGLCIVSTSFSFVRLWRGERRLRKQGKEK